MTECREDRCEFVGRESMRGHTHHSGQFGRHDQRVGERMAAEDEAETGPPCPLLRRRSTTLTPARTTSTIATATGRSASACSVASAS